jgi:hypothetical protein
VNYCRSNEVSALHAHPPSPQFGSQRPWKHVYIVPSKERTPAFQIDNRNRNSIRINHREICLPSKFGRKRKEPHHPPFKFSFLIFNLFFFFPFPRENNNNNPRARIRIGVPPVIGVTTPHTPTPPVVAPSIHSSLISPKKKKKKRSGRILGKTTLFLTTSIFPWC